MNGEYFTKWQIAPRHTQEKQPKTAIGDTGFSDESDEDTADSRDFLAEEADRKEALDLERSRDWIREYGLDNESIQSLRSDERARIALAQFAEQVKSREQFKSSDIFSRSDNPRFTPETDRVYALQQRAEEILTAELRAGTIDIATVVQLIDSTGINAVSQLEHVDTVVFNERRTQYPNDIFYEKEGRHYRQYSPATSLEVDYLKALQDLTDSLSSKDTNYFFKATIPAFIARWQDNHESAPNEENMFGFYEIEKNKLAVVTSKAIMFRKGDRDDSEDLLTEIRELNQLLPNAESGSLDNRLDSIEELADDIGDWSGTDMLQAAEFKNVPPELIGNYVRMLQPETRRVVENDLNIALKSLSIEEQLHLLNYLQHTIVGSFETIKTFFSQYDINALRSFLATSLDADAAENIMVFGTMTEPETAEKVFSSYAQSIDAAKIFGDTLSTQEAIDSPVALLMQELQQGMIKRAGHLFRAAKEISLYEYSGEETMGDLINAYGGVARAMDVLANIEDSKIYTIQKVAPVVGDPSMHTTRYDFSEVATGNTFSLKVAVRPQAAERGEARINFELSLDQLPESDPLRAAFFQTTEYKGSNGKKARQVTGSVIRLGFDLDSRTNPPTFSFDMGRDAYQGDDMSRTGDVLGRILSTVAPEGHHLTDFSPALSKPENFSTIARTIAQWFSTLNPNEGEEPAYYLF